MKFDIKTIIVIYFLVNLLSAFVMNSIWRSYKNRFKGIGFWYAETILQVIGVAVSILRGIIPENFAIWISNTLIIVGMLLVLIGAEHFVGKIGRQIHNYIMICLFSFSLIYFSVFMPSLKIRGILFSIIICILSFQIIFLLSVNISTKLKTITKTIVVAFTAYFIVSVVRIIILLNAGHYTNNFFDSGIVDSVPLLVYFILNVGVLISMILVVTKRLLSEIIVQEEKFNKAFHSVPDAIIITVAGSGEILEVNNGFEKMSLYKREEVIGRKTPELKIWEENESREKILEELAKGKKIHDIETRFRKKSGETLIGLFSADLIDVENKTCILSTIRDITEQKTSEENLRKAKEEAELLTKSKEELLLSISHDLRTPINGILGMSELAVISTDVRKKDEYFHIINNSARHLNSLVGNILSDNKFIKKQDFSIKKLLLEVKQIFEKKCLEKGLELFVYSSVEIPETLFGEYIKIKQVVLNIIENAIKYTNKGGILCDVRVVQERSSEVTLEIEIRDTGIGISEENINKIFEKNYRESEVKEEGEKSYGLGLANVRKILREIGGDITVQSQKNLWSSFVVKIDFEKIEESTKKYRYLGKEEIVIITKNKIVEDYLSAIMQDFRIGYYVLNSIEEYEEIRDEIEKEKIIFIEEEFYIESALKREDDEEIVIITKKESAFENSLEKRINIHSSNENTIYEMIGVSIEDNEVKKKEKQMIIKTYPSIKALILEDNEINIKLLSDILCLMGVVYDVAKTVQDGIAFVTKNNYNIILSDLFLEESDGIDFINQAKKILNPDTIKVVLTASVTEEIIEKCTLAGFDEFVEKPYDIDRILCLFEKYYKYCEKDTKLNETLEEDKKEYYLLFLTQFDREFTKCKDFIEIENYDGIGKIMHKIKSGAEILKEKKIVSLIKKIEEDATKKDKRGIQLYLEKLFAEVQMLRGEIDEDSNN